MRLSKRLGVLERASPPGAAELGPSYPGWCLWRDAVLKLAGAAFPEHLPELRRVADGCRHFWQPRPLVAADGRSIDEQGLDLRADWCLLSLGWALRQRPRLYRAVEALLGLAVGEGGRLVAFRRFEGEADARAVLDRLAADPHADDPVPWADDAASGAPDAEGTGS